MLNSTVEILMSEYYSIKAVLGKYLNDCKGLFGGLCKICLVPRAEEDGLFALAENEAAQKINTAKEFMQRQRVQKYSALTGSGHAGDSEWEETVKIKGNAILAAQSCRLVQDADVSKNVVYDCLSAAVANGSVRALKITGILQCEGIFFDKNLKSGLAKLSMAAKWNDAISILALLRYREDGRPRNMARLRRVLEDTPYTGLYEAAKKRYKCDGAADAEEVWLLNKAFAAGTLKSETYEPQYARILFGKALGIKDKEKALFTQNKETVSVIGDLPLKLSRENIAEANAFAVRSAAVARDWEAAAIERALKNSDLRVLPSYKPLCICSDSKYMLEMYARAVCENNGKIKTEKIDMSEITGYDLEPSPGNIFVRSIDEDKDNRFLLFFGGEKGEAAVEAAKGILQSGRRAKFHLSNPGVTLDLSAVLPICFCDSKTVAALRPLCDVVELAPVARDELKYAVKDIAAVKEKLYGVRITLDAGAEQSLCGRSADEAEKLMDSAVRALRTQGPDCALTAEILNKYSEKDEKPAMGFGGTEWKIPMNY